MFIHGKNSKDFSIIGTLIPLNLPIICFKKHYWHISGLKMPISIFLENVFYYHISIRKEELTTSRDVVPQ